MDEERRAYTKVLERIQQSVARIRGTVPLVRVLRIERESNAHDPIAPLTQPG